MHSNLICDNGLIFFNNNIKRKINIKANRENIIMLYDRQPI
jgi:hypothetical protein